jgi:hypothetical protein
VSADPLERLSALVRAEGGLLADVVGPVRGRRPASPASILRAGRRVAPRGREYELLVEAIYEGYLLHYGAARIVHTLDADLALLAGDHLYALGLARLVELGDSEAVAELADVISLCALAQSLGRRELADAVWQAGAAAVAHGAGADHREAKALARTGDPAAVAALRGAAAKAA